MLAGSGEAERPVAPALRWANHGKSQPKRRGDWMATHVPEARHDVLDGARQEMAVVRCASGERRTIVEDERRLLATATTVGFREGIEPFPKGQDGRAPPAQSRPEREPWRTDSSSLLRRIAGRLRKSAQNAGPGAPGADQDRLAGRRSSVCPGTLVDRARLSAGPQLVAAFGRDPAGLRRVPIEMPRSALSGHPDLSRSSV